MLKIAVCDDEDIFVKKLVTIIYEYIERKHIQCHVDGYNSGLEFTNLQSDMKQYDIVFMDINMDKMNGLETAKVLRQFCPSTYLVFITAFINYTLEGYKFEAIRYILKDYDNMKENIVEALDTILDKMNVETRKIAYDFVGIGQREIELNDIMYIESELHKIVFHIWEKGNPKMYALYKKITDVQTELNCEIFIRSHQSFLVNIRYVKKIKRYSMELTDGDVLPIAKQRYKLVQEEFIKQKEVI